MVAEVSRTIVNYNTVGQLTSLIELDLTFSGIIGSIEFAKLPPRLSTLVMSYNQMSGPLNLENVPPALTYLFLGNNQFDGTLDLRPLAVCTELKHLNLAHNRFSTVTNRESLPYSLLSCLID